MGLMRIPRIFAMLGLAWEEWLVGDAQAEEPVAVFQWIIPIYWSLSHPESA